MYFFESIESIVSHSQLLHAYAGSAHRTNQAEQYF
jgi:hypothetical protein